MKKYLIGVLWITLLFTDAPVSACTGFVASHGDKVLAGNNEDYANPCTKVWFEPPTINWAAQRKRYGRVYFGFDNFWPQGGMNDQGLFFDCFATPSLEVILSKHKRKFNGNLMDKVMADCATVEQALDMMAEFNLEHMRRYQTLIAITRRGNKLYGFYPDNPSNELMRQSGNHFLNITKNGQIKVSFRKDETGKVTGIFVESERINFNAKKIR